MSVLIDRESCVHCGKCAEICPGNLIALDESGAAVLKRPEECWGCASCLKECRAGAIAYFLGEDIGGRGARMRAEIDGDICRWRINFPDKPPVVIAVNRREANQY